MKLNDQNTRYQTSIKDKSTIFGQNTIKNGSRIDPTMYDLRSKSFENKKSLYSKASKTASQHTSIVNGESSRNKKEKKDDDIFSRAPNRTVVNNVTATNNQLAGH